MENNLQEKETSIPAYNNMEKDYNYALGLIDDIILKNYVLKLSEMDIVPLEKAFIEKNIRNINFFKVTKVVYEKDELALHKFTTVFNALSILDTSLFLLVDSKKGKTDFYLGIRNYDSKRSRSSIEKILKNSLQGEFPGTEIETYDEIEDLKDILDNTKLKNVKSISSVTCVANNKLQKEHTNNQNFVQGLEKFVLSMKGEEYTALFLADTSRQSQLNELKVAYENVYSQLSPFASTQINYGENKAINYSKSKTEGKTTGTSYTKNISCSGVTNKSYSESKENTTAKLIKMVGNGISSSAGGLATAALLTGGAALPIAGALGAVGVAVGVVGNLFSKTQTTSSGGSTSYTEGESFGKNETESVSLTETNGGSEGISKAVTLTAHNKSLENVLKRIDKQLERINECESLGMFQFASYFISDNPETAELAATTYKSLVSGENTGVESSAINTWRNNSSENDVKLLAEYISNFVHPVFRYENREVEEEVTACSLISGNELALAMGLPRKSVPGLPVVDHADFGKEVVNYNLSQNTYSKIELGTIYDKGMRLENNLVNLDVESLAMHTFITGSTGAGKSNTVYEILHKISKKGIKFLIVEPAKGEYKNVFGNRKDVNVYGTNSNYTEILRINPFKFPKEVHIYEHIDKLVEIFNVCWPMYAAMPAVLKEAVLKSYEACGWDLTTSENKYDNNIFPNFIDLLGEISNVIKDSEYSDEIKGNYIGSLVTRIKSLTNGLNGEIFSANEINNEKLFDENTIIDLSRIGSTETKSLIMGILVMKLYEYRISNTTGMNSNLKHITVLEEAHNILKRTSTEQSQEGSNMIGKSVEMISNAIAEMRTYGEGFIIADQSPNAVDISAIKNTNTKIIMRLPEHQDRVLAGKSAALKDNQLDEIAKLPKGVAVVYQNDWIEPVLCSINKFAGKEEMYSYQNKKKEDKEYDKIKQDIINCILGVEISEFQKNKILEILFDLNLSGKTKKTLYKLLIDFEEKISLIEKKEIIKEFLKLGDLIDKLKNKFPEITEFRIELNTIIAEKLERIDEEIFIKISECLIYPENQEEQEFYNKWKESLI